MLDLDLRKPGDLARSHLLHRLTLLDISRGRLAGQGNNSKGTFHEVWSLRWEPALAINIITASRWGNSIEQASSRYAIVRAQYASTLPELAKLIQQVLLADLQTAIAPPSPIHWNHWLPLRAISNSCWKPRHHWWRLSATATCARPTLVW
ncbi:DUF5682 family protein [Escherichia coli]